MKKLFPLILLATLGNFSNVKGAQSLATGEGFVGLATGAPYNNVATFRLEFRIHGAWVYDGNTQVVWGSHSYAARIYNSQVNFTLWLDGPGSVVCSLVPPAGTDIIVRMQRFPLTNTATCEYFNAQTGANNNSLVGLGTPGSPTESGQTLQIGGLDAGDIAWERAYNTTVPVGTPPSNTTCTGNLVDYELEGNGNDCSGNAQNLTMFGDTYTTTPTYPPVVSFNSYPNLNTYSTNSTGLQFTSFSFSSTDNATLTYLWAQVSPIPTTGTFTPNTADPNPLFYGSVAGTYGVQLTVTDSAMNSNSASNLHIGAVDTMGPCGSSVINNVNCIVNDHLSAKMHNLVGPLVIGNNTANPWTFGYTSEYPTLLNAAATALNGTYLPVLGAALTGTVSAGNFTTNGAPVTGSGTSFMSQTFVGDVLEIAWNSADGNGTGRGYCLVNTLTSNTALTCQGPLTWPSQSGLTIYHMATGNGCNGINYAIICWIAGSDPNWSWNYYDVCMGLYRAYFETGDTQFLTYADQFADINWQWVIDHGYGRITVPRAMSIISQIYRALELGGSSETTRFAGLAQLNGYLTGLYNPGSIPETDLRDNIAYPQWFLADLAKTDPDMTQHGIYCGFINGGLISTFISKQNSNGGYQEHEFALNTSFVDAPSSYVPGFIWEGSGWRQSLNMGADEATYEVAADTNPVTGCNNPTLAASLLISIENYAGWIYNYTRDNSDRGIFYEIDSASIDQRTLQSPNGPTATCSATNGTTGLTCVNTTFVSSGYVSSNPFIGFLGPRTIYMLSSCVDDLHCTLNIPYGSLFGEIGNLTNSQFNLAPPAVACGSKSLATWCIGGAGDRNLTRTTPARIAWVFNKTGNTMYQTWANELYSATMGGPTQGLNSNTPLYNMTLPCSGPACDGYVGDHTLPAPTCNIPPGTVAPCGTAQISPQQNIFEQFNKPAGEAFGAPGIDNALAWDLTSSPPPPTSTLNISGKSLFTGKILILP